MIHELFVNHLELMITGFLGLLGLLVLNFDLRSRRKLHQEELTLKREQFAAETEERKRRQDAIEREWIRLSEISGPLGKSVAEVLVKDHQWAIEALDKARLGPHAATLFGERSSHFREEKESIAAKFAPLLMQRCRYLVKEKNKKVFLFIDSGTTIYPFFTHLGQLAIRYHADRDNWIDSLFLVTNNLPGISSLMESGRLDPNNRYSPLALNCELLPGVPLPIYSAVTGKKANDALMTIRDKNSLDGFFIGLLTGNWIQLPQHSPLPLARGEGHPEFKKTLIDCSDEVYIITPLGKIFANWALGDINNALGLSSDRQDPDRKPYAEIDMDEAKVPFIKLVTSSRPNGFVLSNHSIRVRDHVGVGLPPPDYSHYISAEPKDVPHIFFPFTKLPQSWFQQLEAEFPHPHTRREEFMTTYFLVPSNAPY